LIYYHFFYLLRLTNKKSKEIALDTVIKDLEPSLLWQHFYAISQIPRCSGNEKSVGDYVVRIAERNQLPHKRDARGNIVVTSPAIGDFDKRPTVILQGHLDMVCEKNNDTIHDFSRDPIKLLRDGDWITADGTTLGADNGIGFCYALALMDDPKIPHPPMEFLFTVDEETGLTGASGLSSDFVIGKKLINLDSEEEGTITIGCAGGRDTVLNKNIEWQPIGEGYHAFKIKLGGLHGGHSGLEIHKGHGNALKLLSRLLYMLKDKTDFRLAALNGGNKHNAIPREAEAILAVEKDDNALIAPFIREVASIYQNEYQYTDKDIFIKTENIDPIKKTFDKSLQKSLIHFLYSAPHGVMAMSHVIPGLVETSTNMAITETHDDRIRLLTSQRSSIATAGKDIADNVKALGELAGFTVKQGNSYPAWQPNPNSELLGLAKKLYKEMTGNEAEVKAVHAGLECGIIGEKFPGMDMISFGPTIQGAHSPDERVHIQSVTKTWDYLLELLKRI
jgi:dipeptidase D